MTPSKPTTTTEGEREINGVLMGWLYLNYDFFRTSLKARSEKLYFSTYRIWFFKTKEDRKKFKLKHNL